MAIYAAYLPESRAADRVVFVRDGFSWPALLFGPIWLIVHRLWLGLAGWLVVVIGLAALSWGLGIDDGALGLLFALWFGLEANAVRRWTLERAGFSLEGIVAAPDRDEAERRFYANWSSPWRADIRPPTPGRGPQRQSGVIGLFPESGVR